MPEFPRRLRAALSTVALGFVLSAWCMSCGPSGETNTATTEGVTETPQPIQIQDAVQLAGQGLGSPVAMLGTYPKAAASEHKQEGHGTGSLPEGHPITEGTAEDAAQETGDEGAEGSDEKKKKAKEEEKERPGIPVTNELVRTRCAQCHVHGEDGKMSRISYVRKSPEGWELCIKRMIRLNSLVVTPEEARELVLYLANDHGLARAEAEGARYEVERRVHWSEEPYEKELRESCGECHTLGRVFAQRRDAKEWKLLKATHLAFFPLAQWQAFQGRRRETIDWESLTESEASDRWEALQNQKGPDQADRVLKELTKNQGLFTPEWEAWQVNRREVPIAGTWSVAGHEISRGDVRGTVEITRVEKDTYETTWKLHYQDGRTVTRKGKGLLYAGYSWRGRSNTTAPKEPEMLRDVLLLNEDWDRMDGRLFTGEYHELGMDVSLYRQGQSTELYSADAAALMIPSEGHVMTLHGTNFPDDVEAADFHLGNGVAIDAVKHISEEQLELTLRVARDAEPGKRFLSYRATRGPVEVVLYDTIDYIKIAPGEGLARIGGSFRPRQMERFEALGMNRGKDDKWYTDDDYVVRMVDAHWALEEFPARENDDDVKFVGEIDPETGVFTPGADGPNPERRFDANNIGDVYVVATCTLNVRKLEKPKKKAKEPADGEEDEQATEETETTPEPLPPIVMEEREFRARGHLLVMVPIYVNWDKYEWDRR